MWKSLRTQFKKITHASKNKRTRTLLLFPLVVVGLVLTITVALQPQRFLQYADNAPPPPFFGCIQLGESNGTNCGTKMGSAGDVTLSLYGRPFNPAKDQVYYGDRLVGSLKYTNVGNIILRMQRLGLAGKSANGNAQFEMFPYLSNVNLAPNASATVTKASHIFNSNDTNGLYRIISKIVDDNGTELPSSDEQATKIKVNATCTALRNKELTSTDKNNLKTFCSSNPKSKLCTSKEYCQIIKGGSCPQADTNPETPNVQCDKYVYMPQPEQDMLEEFCKVYPDSDACENFCGRTIGTSLCPKKYLFIDTSTGKPFPGDGGSNHAIYVRDPDHFKFSYSKYYPIGAVKQSQSETTFNGDSPQAVAGASTGPTDRKLLADAQVSGQNCGGFDCYTGNPISGILPCPAGQHSTGGPLTSAICVPDSPDLTGGAAGGTGSVAPAIPAAKPVPGVPSAPRSVPVDCGTPGNACPDTLTSPYKPNADETNTLSNAFVPCDAPAKKDANGIWVPADGRLDEHFPPSCDGHTSVGPDDRGSLIGRDPITGKLDDKTLAPGTKLTDISRQCPAGQHGDGCLFPCNVNKTDATGKAIKAQGWCSNGNPGGKPVIGQTGYDSSCSSRLREVNAADDALNGLDPRIKDAVKNGTIGSLPPDLQDQYKKRQFSCCARSSKKSLNNNSCCGDACGVWREEIGPGGSTTLRGAPGSNTVCANLASSTDAGKAAGLTKEQVDTINRTDSCHLVNDSSTGDKAGTPADLPGTFDAETGKSICDPSSRNYKPEDSSCGGIGGQSSSTSTSPANTEINRNDFKYDIHNFADAKPGYPNYGAHCPTGSTLIFDPAYDNGKGANRCASNTKSSLCSGDNQYYNPKTYACSSYCPADQVPQGGVCVNVVINVRPRAVPGTVSTDGAVCREANLEFDSTTKSCIPTQRPAMYDQPCESICSDGLECLTFDGTGKFTCRYRRSDPVPVLEPHSATSRDMCGSGYAFNPDTKHCEKLNSDGTLDECTPKGSTAGNGILCCPGLRTDIVGGSNKCY